MVNNLFAGTTPVTGVGADPLAQALNHVSSAGALVGTPATLSPCPLSQKMLPMKCHNRGVSQVCLSPSLI